MGTYLPDLFPDGAQIRKGIRFLAGIPEQGGRVVDGSVEDSVPFRPLAMLPGDLVVVMDQPAGGDPTQADDDFGLYQSNLFLQASCSVFRGSRFFGGRHLTILQM